MTQYRLQLLTQSRLQLMTQYRLQLMTQYRLQLMTQYRLQLLTSHSYTIYSAHCSSTVTQYTVLTAPRPEDGLRLDRLFPFWLLPVWLPPVLATSRFGYFTFWLLPVLATFYSCYGQSLTVANGNQTSPITAIFLRSNGLHSV